MINLVREIGNQEEYETIHNRIFSENKTHIPAIYYKVYENGEYKGFVSGYLHDLITFYIQRIGIVDLFKGKKQSEGLANAIWEHLKKEGFKFLMGTVETNNIPTIIVALKTGFIINGFRVDTGGKQYVEIIKEL